MTDLPKEVIIDGMRYRPVGVKSGEEDEIRDLERRLREFSLDGETFWRNLFIERDTKKDGSGERYGMYDEGDELAPFFSEAFLYNLMGKDDARSLLYIIRQLAQFAGVRFR